MKHVIYLVTSLIIFTTVTTLATAATQTPVTNDNSPIEITADTSLEWNRTARTYTALGNARAVRDLTSVKADTLTAHYAEDDAATALTTLVAKGQVELASPPYTAYGDHGTYDVKTGNAVLTGKDLRIITETEKLTARDKITYSAQTGSMAAHGAVKAVKETQSLEADRMDIHFSENSAGQMQTERMTATGNVTIRTETETAYGDAGVYDAQSQIATLTGHVRIYQGQSYLEGTRATVDMNTGVSALFAEGGATEEDNRVKGVFYPDKNNNAPEQQQAN